jgi:hypothetical protein
LVKKVAHYPYKQTLDLISSNEDYPVRHYEGPRYGSDPHNGKGYSGFPQGVDNDNKQETKINGYR